jgi:hypothetical protein
VGVAVICLVLALQAGEFSVLFENTATNLIRPESVAVVQSGKRIGPEAMQGAEHPGQSVCRRLWSASADGPEVRDEKRRNPRLNAGPNEPREEPIPDEMGFLLFLLHCAGSET